MGLGHLPPLRSLPRAFVPEAPHDSEFELPKEELDKFRRVLRLSPGAHIAILPDDGFVLTCELKAKTAVPIRVDKPRTEPALSLTLAQALPKGDKLDEIVRACTEAGISRFVLFPSDRTVVRWEEAKLQSKLARLETISREAAEVSFRTRLPKFELAGGLEQVLQAHPDCVVLSEAEGVPKPLRRTADEMTVAVGPEGGWSPREMGHIGARGASLGPRVLRVDHAGLAAASILLLAHQD